MSDELRAGLHPHLAAWLERLERRAPALKQVAQHQQAIQEASLPPSSRGHSPTYARARGELGEQRVMDAVESLARIHEWIQGARFAWAAEDAAGIDIVVHTDVGDLFLQVKSSKKAAKLFRRRGRERGITDIYTVLHHAGHVRLMLHVLRGLQHLRRLKAASAPKSVAPQSISR